MTSKRTELKRDRRCRGTLHNISVDGMIIGTVWLYDDHKPQISLHLNAVDEITIHAKDLTLKKDFSLKCGTQRETIHWFNITGE